MNFSNENLRTAFQFFCAAVFISYPTYVLYNYLPNDNRHLAFYSLLYILSFGYACWCLGGIFLYKKIRKQRAAVTEEVTNQIKEEIKPHIIWTGIESCPQSALDGSVFFILDGEEIAEAKWDSSRQKWISASYAGGCVTVYAPTHIALKGLPMPLSF